MPLVQIYEGGNESVPPGHYQAVFQGIESIKRKDEGECWKWSWKTDKGEIISDLSDTPGETQARVTNKLGKWLCLLANRPLEAGKVHTDEYIGKKYFVIVGPKPNGKTKIETFSLIA